VSLYDQPSSVSGARFATAGRISSKGGFPVPPRNTHRLSFHFRDLTYFKRNAPLFGVNMFFAILFSGNQEISLFLYVWQSLLRATLTSQGEPHGKRKLKFVNLKYEWYLN
jgi:hypothetical protein